MIKNNIKTNLIDKLTNNKQNVICDIMLTEKINTNISAVLVKDIACIINNIPSIYNGDIRSVSINQLKHFDGVILNVMEFSKDEIKIFSQLFANNNISVIYNISNTNDIIKIRFLKPKVVIISQNTIQNPVAVKLNIDWQCSCILNPKTNISMAYINEYGFIPPFVLIKVLTWGELSRLYSMLKQTDRQAISKEFKVPDNFLKQVMKNITMIRNICAHNDRMFSFHSKFLITFKIIDSNYNNKDNSTNVYMIMKSMQRLLDKDKSDEFERLINLEIEKLKKNIKSVDINLILY